MCRAKGNTEHGLGLLKEADVLETLIHNTDDDLKLSGSKLKDKGLSPKDVSKTIYQTAQRACGSLPRDSVQYDGSKIHVGQEVRKALLSVCKLVGYSTS